MFAPGSISATPPDAAARRGAYSPDAYFDKWARSGDPVVRQRILDYNEDDCRATRVLLDGIRGLSLQ